MLKGIDMSQYVIQWKKIIVFFRNTAAMVSLYIILIGAPKCIRIWCSTKLCNECSEDVQTFWNSIHS